MNQQERAQQFHDLHKDFFVLPNAWDAGSAYLLQEAGAPAIATSSGAQSWSQAIPDGRSLEWSQVLDNITRIVNTVDLPVSADIENGYASDTAGVRQTVLDALQAGVVGINLEDAGANDSPLFSVDEQAERISAARQAAVEQNIDLFINARTDVFLLGVGEEDGRLDEVISRGNAYREAGANGLFIPGLLDTESLRTVANETGLKINAMWLAGAPAAEELRDAGVTRYSAGTALAQVAYTSARDAGRAFLSGDDTAMANAIDYFAFNDTFSR